APGERRRAAQRAVDPAGDRLVGHLHDVPAAAHAALDAAEHAPGDRLVDLPDSARGGRQLAERQAGQGAQLVTRGGEGVGHATRVMVRAAVNAIVLVDAAQGRLRSAAMTEELIVVAYDGSPAAANALRVAA